MKQSDALSLLTLLISSAIGIAAAYSEKKEKAKAKEQAGKIIDVFSKQVSVGEAREWYRKLLPPTARRERIGSRLWIHHPVRINNRLFMTTSTSLDGVYVIDSDNMAGFIQWDEIQDIYICLDSSL